LVPWVLRLMVIDVVEGMVVVVRAMHDGSLLSRMSAKKGKIKERDKTHDRLLRRATSFHLPSYGG
jgi:hypothetical protein